MIAVEIDPKLVEILKKKLADCPNVEVVKSDILKVDFKSFLKKEGRPVKVVANLPYQISTPLLFRFIELKEAFSTFTLMLQKEVAERMVASPGGKEYGRLSVLLQMFLDLSVRFFIPPSAFFPRPKVESAVVQWVGKKNQRRRYKTKSGLRKWLKHVLATGERHCSMH